MIEVNPENISEVIAGGESETIEFKTSFNDESIEAVGAFSNSRGGSVFIGIGNSGEICGYQIGNKTIEDIANRIQEATDPRLQPYISIVTPACMEKKIVVIQVPPAAGTPISVRGRYFRRTGKTNQRMSHEEIMKRMVDSVGLSWDAIVENGASPDDLDSNLIKRFIKSMNELKRRPIPEQTSDHEVLRKLEFVRDGSPTRAALLLFGKNPGFYFSSAFLKMGRFRSPTLIVDDHEVHGSLINQLDESTS